jgi:fumarate hydratase class I
MPDFSFQEIFPSTKDTTPYRLLTKEPISLSSFEGREIVMIAPEGLTLLAEQAFHDVSFFLRPSHLGSLAGIMDDPESSDNDNTVAFELLQNAVISAEGIFPMCQDTGTAIVFGKKGRRVWTDGRDEEALSRGVFNAYRKNHLRYSMNAALTMDEEKNTGSNLPAEIDIRAVDGDAYEFLFIAKGGGSANKTFLFQETKAVLNPGILPGFLAEKMKTLGTAACPPYHLAVVVGGTSPELTLKTVKLASAGYLDGLPATGNSSGRAFRDAGLEARLLDASRRFGLGAQFGGKYFCLDVRVIRLPRHGASCPIGMGVSCNADRNVKAKITRDGLFLERLETEPARYLRSSVPAAAGPAVPVDLNRPMSEIRAFLSRYPVGTRLALNGRIVIARDIAHARWKERLERGEDLPSYFKEHVICYAGPAKTPPGYPCGSFGPTTAGRMDVYVPLFQHRGGSLVMMAKGNRSPAVTESCRRYGGFYLGSIGGAGARLGRDRITKCELIDYPELGMEAVQMLTVRDFPAFILIDDKGNDFFLSLGE